MRALQSEWEENELPPCAATDEMADLTFERIDLLFQNVDTDGTLVVA